MNTEQKHSPESTKEGISTDPHSHSSISRRRLLMSAAAFAAAGKFLEADTARPSPDTPKDQPPILALIGDRYHNSDYIHVALDRVFSELGLPWDYTTRYDQLSANLLRGRRVLIIFRGGSVWPGGYLEPNGYCYGSSLENAGAFPQTKPQGWITEQQAEAVRDFVAEGNGLYVIHSGCEVANFAPVFKELLGGEYADHAPLRPFKVNVMNKTHPITEGIADFMVTDEQYFPKYYGDPKNILLQGDNIDGLTFSDRGTKSVSGWAHEYEKGRVVFTGIGHSISVMWAPEHLKLQKRSVEWLLKKI